MTQNPSFLQLELYPTQSNPAPVNQTSDRSVKQKKYVHPHVIIPSSDMEWAFQQRIPVLKLWGDAWRSDPYGSRWVRLETTLGKENFRKAKKDLIDAGLFQFECRIESSGAEHKYCWWVKNLHGCRTDYWKKAQKNNDLNNITLDFQTLEQSEFGSESNLDNIVSDFHTEEALIKGDGTLSAEFQASDTTVELKIENSDNIELNVDLLSQQPSSADVDIDKTSNLDNLPSTNCDEIKVFQVNPGAGANITRNGVLFTVVGNDNTTSRVAFTNYLDVNALITGVSRVLKNVSETAYKHFSNSLNIQGRQGFINFCVDKIQSLKKVNFEVRTWDAWIARHYEQYMNEWGILSSKRVEEPKRTSLDEFNSWRSELLEKEKRAKEQRMLRREQLQTA
ncbi:hypothetical protein NIES4071_107420 (plasmid) [Calothrix sp. NIES-4071]|nr:hypothetical protein NIES4071_107420 [Calothrix sp. NIES-4071]BAZ64782.1 hypothetical protein NIES4105_105150 [Calothrix sp. NIES-4105]